MSVEITIWAVEFFFLKVLRVLAFIQGSKRLSVKYLIVCSG